jgi:hypothetical protein
MYADHGVYDLDSPTLREAHLASSRGDAGREVSRLAAERSALLQALADQRAARPDQARARRQPGLGWARAALGKFA